MGSEATWPPAFSLDQERILELLTGDRFYTDPSAALREAILNALDALHRRTLSDPSHSGEIVVTFDREVLSLTVADTGDGMDPGAVTSLFARVGASAASLRGDDGAIGEFGIGVISYFMAADSFLVETWNGISEPLALRFRKEMIAGGPAEVVEPGPMTQGTTLRLDIRDRDTYQLLLEKFPYWCRRVESLVAFESPEQRVLTQGETLGRDNALALQTPPSIEEACLRAVTDLPSWEPPRAESTVGILYRGVYVQDYSVEKLWGIEGTLHVDPKRFKPRLNREGFVGVDFSQAVDDYLASVHPAILEDLARALGEELDAGHLDRWSAQKWANLWLSVPRSGRYAPVAEVWDNVFRRVPAFEVAKGDRWLASSVQSLIDLDGPIYVLPPREDKHGDLVKSAARLLRARGLPVLKGLARQSGALKGAPTAFPTTADLISERFASELPPFISIASTAEQILTELDALHLLYGGEHPVALVQLGTDSPPVVRAGPKLLINVDTDAGKAIVERTIEVNRGRSGLIEAAAEHAIPSLQQVAKAVHDAGKSDPEVLGLVKRHVLRNILQ